MRRFFLFSGCSTSVRVLGLSIVLISSAAAFAQSVDEDQSAVNDHWPVVNDDEATFTPINWRELQPEIIVPPVEELDTEVSDPEGISQLLMGHIATGAIGRSLLSEVRRSRTQASGTDVVFGNQSIFRATSDAGNLMKKTPSNQGVDVQQRTPIVSDPRIRGDRIGRLLASGSYWAPARQDLDTMLNKIDSRLIHNLIVIKGPYSSLYGPGFNFVDFELMPSPRYCCGPTWEGMTSFEYKTNAQQWYGRTMLQGGAEDYGYRLSYGHRTGNDYTMGNGDELPTSYNSRDLEFSIGYDIGQDQHLEFSYLRLDQTNVEFPGLVFDINTLVTNGFETTYTITDQPRFDRLTVHGWYNQTRFDGDTSRSGKNAQIPSLRGSLRLGDDQFAVTDVDAMSTGYRTAVSWGDFKCRQLTLGTDLIRISEQLNDVLPVRDVFVGFPPPGQISTVDSQNFPVPRSHSNDVGLFFDWFETPQSWLKVNVGGRLDLVQTDAREMVPGMGEQIGFPDSTLVEVPLSELKQSGIEQHFTLWSLYVNTDILLTDEITLLASAGHGQRPPTLTELYAVAPFIGTINPGFSAVTGDPQLKAEKKTQVDLGFEYGSNRTRMRLQGFYAWINDFITYDWVFLFPNTVPGEDIQTLYYTNTDLATLTGVEFAFDRQVSTGVNVFALLSYVHGEDHTRNDPARLAPAFRQGQPRSGVDDDNEPLPGISPFESFLGIRFHQPCANPAWGIEVSARLVAAQNRVAASLAEFTTGGFAVGNVRGYWRPRRNLTLLGGVENFTDTFYREHLDYRTGRGVFQPGVNFYFATQLDY